MLTNGIVCSTNVEKLKDNLQYVDKVFKSIEEIWETTLDWKFINLNTQALLFYVNTGAYNIPLSNFGMVESYNVTVPTKPNTNLFIAHDDLAQREPLNVIYLRKLLDVLCSFQYSHTWTSPKK